MTVVVARLRAYLLGWKAYFGAAQLRRQWRALDEWIRHRLRALLLNQWRHGRTIYRRLRTLGGSELASMGVASCAGQWWRASNGDINRILTVRYFDRLGVPRLL